jgi:diguanylate cyclase (GGDEF)-like protein
MHLFPIGVGGEISAAIAILDPIETDETKSQIVRICQSLAPQLEILRLRSEVARRETLTNAIRAFSTSLKKVDVDDVWLSLTQIAAEMLSAERASLMLYDERTERFELKAMIGVHNDFGDDDNLGARIAKIVLERGEAALIADVTKTDLPAFTKARGYKTNSFLSCPIKVGGRSLGVINFADRSDGSAFDKNALKLFLAIAPQLAIAIDRAMLRDKAGEYEQLSVTDPLTGLLNRRYIEERLLEEVKRSNRHGFPMSFMMLDVDHFKSYNDQFGHPAGDDALRLVAQVIRETLRAADVAARFGGEEFSILLPQTTREEAAAIAERIRHNIEQTRFAHRVVTSSIGIASCSAELCVSADLVAAADKALYEAKRKGRNRVQAFDGMIRK